jgi:hypothetical protein
MFLTERHTNEGFSQTDRFAKYDAIYDEFYNKVYDTINVPHAVKTVLAAINTKPQIRATTYFGRGVRDRNGFERIV